MADVSSARRREAILCGSARRHFDVCCQISEKLEGDKGGETRIRSISMKGTSHLQISNQKRHFFSFFKIVI